ncbi:kinase-like domain-containing protein [Hyaloraphidium curvatum]|nr:kinase-like domain-containing protein [Hyaloraphidium curvatum]
MHSLAGTPFFLPPEMVRGAPYTASVDAWALGCTAYQILFGCTPFQKKAETLADLYAGIARAELEFPEDVEVSGAAKDFLSRLLDADAASRSTVTGALAHPWIADMLPAAADAEDDDACSVYSVESGVEVRFNELGELEVVDAGKRADSGVGWAEGEWGRYSPR